MFESGKFNEMLNFKDFKTKKSKLTSQKGLLKICLEIIKQLFMDLDFQNVKIKSR